MDDDPSSGRENVRATWTPPQDQYFVELLLDQVHQGNKTCHAFKQQAWVDMITQFNTKFGFSYDIDVLKNRYKRMRKQYNEMKVLVDQDGFEWDELLQMVRADDNTWDAYIKDHPDTQPYRTKVVPYYKELCIICGHAVADGRYSLSCFDVDFENEGDHEKRMNDQTPNNTDRSKIDWSRTMDQYFLELMLDQVHEGNKVGCTFKKKAWVHMITLFNAKFGFQHSRAVLKNRFKILRNQYASIKILLGEKGFHWDETKKMVSADDHDWNKHIKEHPEFRRYKDKSIPCYDDMCIICQNEAVSLKKITTHRIVSSKNGAPRKLIDGKAAAVGDKRPMANPNGAKDAHKKTAAPGGVKTNLVDQQKKRQTETPITSQQPKKARIEDDDDDGMANVLREMVVMVNSLTKKKENDTVSPEKVIKELQAISGIDDDLLLDACDFLEDEGRARMFLALDAPLRKKWLMRKLRPQ